MPEKTIHDLEELKEYAAGFVATLRGGETIGLVGELGAGKTAFVQEVARALGVESAVTSPTFVLMGFHKTGAGAAARGIRTLCHVDAYRLKEESELWGIGFGDYVGKPDTVTFVEWADRVPSLRGLPGYHELKIGFDEGEVRRLSWDAASSPPLQDKPE